MGQVAASTRLVVLSAPLTYEQSTVAGTDTRTAAVNRIDGPLFLAAADNLFAELQHKAAEPQSHFGRSGFWLTLAWGMNQGSSIFTRMFRRQNWRTSQPTGNTLDRSISRLGVNRLSEQLPWDLARLSAPDQQGLIRILAHHQSSLKRP